MSTIRRTVRNLMGSHTPNALAISTRTSNGRCRRRAEPRVTRSRNGNPIRSISWLTFRRISGRVGDHPCRSAEINCERGYVTGQSKQRLSHRLKRPHVRYDEVRQKFIDPIVLERPAKARAGEYVDLVEREYDFFRAVASQTNARFPLPNLNTPFLKIGCIYTRAAS